MIAFAYWDSTPSAPDRQAELIYLWVRGCLARGWTPRLLTARDAQKSRQYKDAIKKGVAGRVSLARWALKSRRGRALANLEVYRHQL